MKGMMKRRQLFSCLEAAPIPFEKDDDFQIDFIAAATVNTNV